MSAPARIPDLTANFPLGTRALGQLLPLLGPAGYFSPLSFSLPLSRAPILHPPLQLYDSLCPLLWRPPSTNSSCNSLSPSLPPSLPLPSPTPSPTPSATISLLPPLPPPSLSRQALVASILPLLAGRYGSCVPDRGVEQHDRSCGRGHRSVGILPTARVGNRGISGRPHEGKPREERQEDRGGTVRA